jgi:peptidoglycan/LPS O-acetylase OafA/YrhL
MLFFLGGIALLASAGDFRVLRSRGIQGARRLARHLWRMCFAFFIATGSFFLGQADEIPEPLRFTPLLVILALAPLVIMLYWLWRVRIRKTFREMSGSVETRVS